MQEPDWIGRKIKSCCNLIDREFNASIRKVEAASGITGMQGMVIGYLSRQGESCEVFQRDLEREFHITRSSATGLLKLMENNGLITRTPVDYDARLKRLQLTPKATTILEEVNHCIKAFEQQLRQCLTEEQVAALFHALDLLEERLS
ncbi:MAG: winged helix-turn-helix transcriptional regulator [Anaerotruncus sp.]|nr:winged helix-turn-helix transcriptional regulator [Anaerotruncus sp.]